MRKRLRRVFHGASCYLFVAMTDSRSLLLILHPILITLLCTPPPLPCSAPLCVSWPSRLVASAVRLAVPPVARPPPVARCSFLLSCSCRCLLPRLCVLSDHCSLRSPRPALRLRLARPPRGRNGSGRRRPPPTHKQHERAQRHNTAAEHTNSQRRAGMRCGLIGASASASDACTERCLCIPPPPPLPAPR